MKENNASFDKLELAVNLGESSVQFLPDDWKCKGICIDSRTARPFNLFVSIKGENTDGHNFIEQAIEKDVSAVVVSNEWFKNNSENFDNAHLIVVKDTLKTLGKLAAIHRNRFDLPIIAIAGSNGKTTTKDLAASVLSEKYNVLNTYKNFNNQIGVPLMLFQLNEDYDIAVLEIGTNEPGEIAILSEMTAPTHGLITNIAEEHLENLIDLDGVEMEETFLFGYLHKTNGYSFINMDDNRLKKYTTILEEAITFGTQENLETIITGKINVKNNLKPVITLKAAQRKLDANLNTYGYTSALNALSAAAIGLHFNLTDEEIKTGLENYQLDISSGYGRMAIEKFNDFILINDCYNANPESMKSALNNLSDIIGNKKIAVLADMRELGENTIGLHKKILNYALDKADEILTYGEVMNSLKNDFHSKNINSFNDKNKLFELLKSQLNNNNVVLIKGSRGLKMEEIVLKIKDNL